MRINDIPILTKKSLVLGIGNTLKQDDGAGPLLIQGLSGKVDCHLIDAGSAPENFIGKIRKINPDKIIIVDVVDFKAAPGKIKVFRPEEIADETFSTHGISIKVLADFIKSESGAEIIIIGIQPRSMGFGQEISEPIKKAVSNIKDLLIKQSA